MSQQVNLFNPAFQKQRQVFTAATMARALAVLAFGAIALVMVGRQRVATLEKEVAAGATQLAQKKARQAAVMIEFAPRKKSPEMATRIADAEADLASLQQVSSVIQRGDLGNTEGYADYFKALARQSTGELWLTGVSIVGAGQRIGLQGRALEARVVPAYISRLTREPVMRGKSFASLDIRQGELKTDPADTKPAQPAPYIEFSLQAAPLPPGGVVQAPAELAK